jgi:hypothetical protein
MTDKKRSLQVRRYGDPIHSVHSVEVSNPRQYERVMSGMLRNMDTENYYVDDSEFDDIFDADGKIDEQRASEDS